MGVAMVPVGVVPVVVEEDLSNNCALVGVARGCLARTGFTCLSKHSVFLKLLLVFLKVFNSPLRC